MKEKTWSEIDKIPKDSPVLVPIGSFEQHGYHAPLNTDCLIAEKLAESVASEKDTISTPCVPVGVSDYHRSFPGTLWVPPETFKDYVGQIARSLKYHGFGKVIFVNGHGGNEGPLHEVSRELRRTSGIYSVAWIWYVATGDEIEELFEEPGYPEEGYGLHADAVETSMLMAIDEGLVKREMFGPSEEGSSREWRISKAGAVTHYDVGDFSQSGVSGRNLEEADPKKGKILLEKSKEKLASLVDWMKETNIEDFDSPGGKWNWDSRKV